MCYYECSPQITHLSLYDSSVCSCFTDDPLAIILQERYQLNSFFFFLIKHFQMCPTFQQRSEETKKVVKPQSCKHCHTWWVSGGLDLATCCRGVKNKKKNKKKN